MPLASVVDNQHPIELGFKCEPIRRFIKPRALDWVTDINYDGAGKTEPHRGSRLRQTAKHGTAQYSTAMPKRWEVGKEWEVLTLLQTLLTTFSNLSSTVPFFLAYAFLTVSYQLDIALNCVRHAYCAWPSPPSDDGAVFQTWVERYEQ